MNSNNSNSIVSDNTSNNNESSPLIFPECTIDNNYGIDFILGFDGEWGHQNLHSQQQQQSPQQQLQTKVALIQIASKDIVYLIHLAQMPSFPKALEAILVDPRIIKVGVAISQDAAIIFKSFQTVVKGCVDLVPLGKLTNFSGNGLASLAASVLNVKLDKSHHIRCSHWEQKHLTAEQIHYAATDAYISRKLFIKMFKHQQSRSVDKQLLDPFSFCRPFINTSFKFKTKSSDNSSSSSNGSNNNNKKKKDEAKTFKNMVPDNRVLYDNCLMFNKDGVLLCNISRKKVQWYVSRNLAVIINEDPLSIELKFEPKGNGHANDDYYLADKKNICVVCGSDYKILRHSVVPHCYRQYLPEEIKSHSSHDVVLLCCDCHVAMDKRVQIMRMMIASEYGIPLETGNKAFIVDPVVLKLSKYAKIIKQHFFDSQPKKSKCPIPESKLEEMKKDILSYLSKDTLELKDIEHLVSLNPKQKNEDYVPHEKLVMEKVLEKGEEGMQHFVRLWRKNFIETVQPKHLNPYWSIDRPIMND
eukprot:gene7647-9405_t